MLVVFANNQVLVANDSDDLEITTDPQPVGENNYVECVLSVHKIFQLSSTPTVQLTWKGQGSNDGQTFFDITGLTESKLNTDPAAAYDVSGNLTVAFFRIYFQLAITAGSGIGAAAFDFHANIIQK